MTIGTRHEGKTETSVRFEMENSLETIYKTTTFSNESTEKLKYKYTETIHNCKPFFR